MKKEINYTALMEEIRDIFLDEGRTTLRDQSYQDEGGWHSSFELESTRKQDTEVVELIRKFFADGVITVVEEIFKDE